LLARIGSGIVWVVALLAALLSLDRFSSPITRMAASRIGPGAAAARAPRLAKGAGALLSPACRWRCSRRCSACCSASIPPGYWRVGRRHGGSARRALSLIGAVGAALTLGRAAARRAAIAPRPAALYPNPHPGGGRRRGRHLRVGARPQSATFSAPSPCRPAARPAGRRRAVRQALE